jgi:hypothetical protein
MFCGNLSYGRAAGYCGGERGERKGRKGLTLSDVGPFISEVSAAEPRRLAIDPLMLAGACQVDCCRVN